MHQNDSHQDVRTSTHGEYSTIRVSSREDEASGGIGPLNRRKGQFVLSIVELLPPAPAERVLFGLALAIFSFWSAAARLRITARAPPGGGGESGRAVDWPEAGGEFTGDAGRGEDCEREKSMVSLRMSTSELSNHEGGLRAGDGGEGGEPKAMGCAGACASMGRM